MSFKAAKENLEQALQAATAQADQSMQEFLIEGLLQMNKGMQNEFRDMEARLRTLEQLVRRLGWMARQKQRQHLPGTPSQR